VLPGFPGPLHVSVIFGICVLDGIAPAGRLLPNLAGLAGRRFAPSLREDRQISLTDPDARSMATSGKDTGIVGYNVQIAVDTQHHLIVAHQVTNVGTDRHQLASMAEQARDEMAVETLDVVADRGYYDGAEIMACEEAGITCGAARDWPSPCPTPPRCERFGERRAYPTIAFAQGSRRNRARCFPVAAWNGSRGARAPRLPHRDYKDCPPVPELSRIMPLSADAPL
jgi:hypothetical protein